MSQRFAIAILLGLGLLASTLVAAARDDEGTRAESHEVLLGSYRCGAGAEQAYLSLLLQASGGVLPKDTNLFRPTEVREGPAETCEASAAAMAAAVEGAGCARGPIEARQDESGAERGLYFVCEARRSGIVRAIAAVSSQLLTASP